ncbi:MAG TPA: hypothetical protein VJ836_01955 [Candidatus Saccharimonadales bacterium]|nr:hypothetical protein [Candidatus Saccharimonadales bacterium]
MPRVWSITKTAIQGTLRRGASDAIRHAGFSVVEVILAATVLGFLATALVGALVYGRSSTAGAGDRTRAIFLADEGFEATRNITNAAYANLVDGTRGLTQSGGPLVWAFLGTTDTTGIYTRQITIASAGTDRKSITSTVTWPQAGGTTGSAVITSRLTNWRAAIDLWSNGIIAGSADATGTTDAIKTDTVGIYAYTVRNTTSSNFVVTDISNPAAPVIIRTVTIAGTPTNITVSGNYAYVTNTSDTAELQVVDVTNPVITAPSVVHSVNMTGAGNGQSVAVSGNYAFVARAADTTAGANEFTVVNISNPLTASVTGGYNNNISMNGMTVLGNFAYVPTSSTTQEMLVINITTPTAPALTIAYNAPTAVAAQTISGFGSTVFLAAGTTLRSINVATPSAPVSLGTFTAAGTINDIEIDITDQFAFLGTSSTTAEFQVVNIANPASMSLTRSVDASGTATTISGVSYNSSYDIVVGASASNTQEILVFRRN